MKLRVTAVILIPMIVPFLMCAKNNSGSDETQHSEAIRVQTAPVVLKEISPPIQTSGRLATRSEAKLSFKIGGIIEEIIVDEGQQVKKGKLLAQLDQSEISARVNQARSALEKATRDKERVDKLHADNAASLEQKQNAATALDMAQANLKIAEHNFQHTAILAPSDGKILKRFIEKNEMVAPGMPIFVFASAGKAWIVRAGVTDFDIIRLQLGDAATVTFDAYPGVIFEANIAEIAEIADPMSGTFEVELKVNQGNYKLISGFVAKVSIVPSLKQKFATIPIEALAEAEGENGFVYTVEGNTARKIPVQISNIFGSEIAIRSGLENIAFVVTDGAAYLMDGKTVEVVDAP